MKKGTLLLSQLQINPMKYSEMQRFLKSLHKTENGYAIKPFWAELVDWGGELKPRWMHRIDYQGYWCTNLTFFKWTSKVIEKGEDGLYRVPDGADIHHPFKNPYLSERQVKTMRKLESIRRERRIAEINKQTQAINNKAQLKMEEIAYLGLLEKSGMEKIYEDDNIIILKKS